jgi:hypothetical protein
MSNPLRTAKCLYCSEPVLESDRIGPYPVNGEPVHWECGLRCVVGGLNHLNGQCSCCGGTLPPDPEGCTRREAARMAAQVWIARNPLKGNA